MPNRGPRLQVTVRLPYDEYREVARRARSRNWSLSDYIGYCIGKEIGAGRKTTGPGKTNEANVVLYRDFEEFDDDESD